MSETNTNTWSGSDGRTQVFLVEDLTQEAEGYARGPERALLSALLFDGIQAYMNYATCDDTTPSRDQYREAYLWVHTTGCEYVFSFENVCEALGIHPEYLRLGLANATNSQTFEWRRSRRNF
ncbi:MAG: hypothetical protein KDD55_08180 [Bdellovibrionales bacterium]|nr:hypothetical protein [Bdellovibrionales bacterium]